MVKHTQTIFRQIADKLFECVWLSCRVGAKRVNEIKCSSFQKSLILTFLEGFASRPRAGRKNGGQKRPQILLLHWSETRPQKTFTEYFQKRTETLWSSCNLEVGIGYHAYCVKFFKINYQNIFSAYFNLLFELNYQQFRFDYPIRIGYSIPSTIKYNKLLLDNQNRESFDFSKKESANIDQASRGVLNRETKKNRTVYDILV